MGFLESSGQDRSDEVSFVLFNIIFIYIKKLKKIESKFFLKDCLQKLHFSFVKFGKIIQSKFGDIDIFNINMYDS